MRSRRIVRPWRSRSQNATTRRDSTAKATTPRIASAVIRNSVRRKFDARNDRSKASSLAKSGGLGKTPWVKA